MTCSTVVIEPGYKGSVSGVTAARFHQRATVKLLNTTGRCMGSTTFIGTGDNNPLIQEVNCASHSWSFGPFKERVSVEVLIENSENGDNFCPSKVINPVNVTKHAEGSYPANYSVSTILSEDYVDNDYTDCILSVFQYQ